ncbi:hypothetical protein ACIA5C_15545 [Actinoplanes sp. NPDC051343]|uniref:hypothetical protein n=1 Tax=Actinoplanes sp. NPDC051343 TaxID=3363906 RepID=UPI0037BBBC33
MARIYVMRDDGAIVVSRRRPGLLRSRPVPRSWDTLVEIPPRTGRAPGETTLVFASPVALGALATTFAPVELGVAVGGAALIASTYLTPRLRRRLADRRRNRPDNIVLHSEKARSAFDHVLGLADRVSETWPLLDRLVEPDEAAALLAEALWQIAAVLSRREELDAVLEPAGFDPSTASVETRSQLSAARAARARVDAEFQRREAGLRRAEEAGLDFIREQQMRKAVQAADQTLRSMPPTVLVGPGATLEPASDLAEHTHSVLAAYRELTVGLTADR